jgi:hypothetical protein
MQICFSDKAMSRLPQERARLHSRRGAPCSQTRNASSCSSLSIPLSQLAMRASRRLLAASIGSTAVARHARRPSRVHRLMRCRCVAAKVGGKAWLSASGGLTVAARRGASCRSSRSVRPAGHTTMLAASIFCCCYLVRVSTKAALGGIRVVALKK